MSNESKSIDLPAGWVVVKDSAVGVSMKNEKGDIVAQHPYDSAAWRRMVLAGYYGPLSHEGLHRIILGSRDDEEKVQ